MALATVVRTARPHEGTAYQRFLLDGPVALLPSVHPRQSSVVWSQPPGEARRRRELTDDAFCIELERALQSRLGRVEAVDQRVSFPLQQQLADTFNPHPRVLLVGDAARVLHPMAGLGGNLGFEDVREVLAVMDPLGGGSGRGRPVASTGSAARGLMLRVMDTLRQVYSRGDPMSQWLRNLGVAWLDRASPLKRQIMMEAMGLGPVARGASAGSTGNPAAR